MTDSQAYVAFNLSEGVGFSTVEKLVEEAGSVVVAWERFDGKVSRTGEEVDWQREFEKAAQLGVTILTPADADYPRQLRCAPGRPLALYVKGDVKALSKPALAIVGTRRATAYGKDCANRFAYDLSRAGWAIVSGLALGIDAEAHRGALEAGGVTVGVIGSALDEFFPKQNLDLAREIVSQSGAVVSEFPFGRPPDRETFPIRNHVVAALASGVVAVEAPQRSGTLITAEIAADLGRTVMAVPARIDNKMSAGCLQLIRDGAVLVRNADDVLGEMNELLPRSARLVEHAREAELDAEIPAYSAEEALVMLQVDSEGVSIDELTELTGLSVEKVNATVMQLRLKGFIKFLPGNRISRLTGKR